MAELFSTVAGVASLIDVALRACNVLYDSSRYLKDAPQLSQRLRRTIASVKSILQSLNDSLTLYRQQQATTGLPDILPGAIESEVISIKAELDTLSALLPTSSANSQFRTKVKWILDRKKVDEVIQALDSHQITLTLALQTFAQVKNSRVYDDFVQRLECNYRQHEHTTKTLQDQVISGNAGLHADLSKFTQSSQALLPVQEAIRSGLNNLNDAVSTGQSTLNTKLEYISTTLSRISVRNNHLQSSTIVIAPSEDVLARVIMPTVQQCLEKFKASLDPQLGDIRKKVDEMAQQVCSRSSGDGISSSSSSTPDRTQSHIHQDSVDLINPCDLRTSPFGASQYQNQPISRLYKRWYYTWRFRWTIGTLCVTISTSVTKRSTSPDYSTSGFVPSQKVWRVTVTFIPAISLYQFRGVLLSAENTRDQRGYYQICPFLSTFAVVPNDAEVMECARRNDVEGLQSLFQRGLAAPSDRDNDGQTPLMCAVYEGSADVCRFLLNEGSDTKATDANGMTLFDHANQGFARAQIHGDWLAIINMLQHSDGDIVEHASLFYLFNALSLRSFYSKNVRSKYCSAYLQRLKQLGIRFTKDSLWGPPISLWLMTIRIYDVSVTMKPGNIEFILQTMLEFGADSNARFYWDTPFHLLFRDHHFGDDTRLNVQRHNLMEIAKALLKQGADPFALNDNGASVLDIAENYGWTTELYEVLQQTGHDLDKVRRKIFLAKWFFFNPDHAFAMSTTIDCRLNKPPSREGLSLRRAMSGDRLED
ncbi:MAG: hypothetical protein Q9178_007448 [Gyalolechia marmorata]